MHLGSWSSIACAVTVATTSSDGDEGSPFPGLLPPPTFPIRQTRPIVSPRRRSTGLSPNLQISRKYPSKLLSMAFGLSHQPKPTLHASLYVSPLASPTTSLFPICMTASACQPLPPALLLLSACSQDHSPFHFAGRGMTEQHKYFYLYY